MGQPDSLEARVAALETTVHELAEQVKVTRQDAAAAWVLAGGADRDAAGIRDDMRDFRQAATSSLNAMREDLVDLRDQTRAGFIEMRAKFDAAAAGQQQIADLLRTLTERESD